MSNSQSDNSRKLGKSENDKKPKETDSQRKERLSLSKVMKTQVIPNKKKNHDPKHKGTELNDG